MSSAEPHSATVSDDPREPLHNLNGQLILALKRILPRCKWNEWIVNAIMLHRTLGAVEIVTLETSATMHRDSNFFSNRDCGNEKKVRSLDGQVPFDDSFAGYCIREGNVVWVDDMKKALGEYVDNLEDGKAWHPLQDKYRSFGYVGVETEGPPYSEYVFPIRLRTGLSDAIWGVLNCEWYGAQTARRPESYADKNHFQELGRTVVTHRVTSLLDIHARFLPLAFDRIHLPVGDWAKFVAYYDQRIDEQVRRIVKGVEDNEDPQPLSAASPGE